MKAWSVPCSTQIARGSGTAVIQAQEIIVVHGWRSSAPPARCGTHLSIFKDRVAVKTEIHFTSKDLDYQIYRVGENTIVHESYNAYTEQSRTALDPAPSCGRKADTEATQ